MLNYIWIFFFLSAFVIALFKLLFWGDTQVFSLILNSTFEMAEVGFKISLGLTGILSLWLGLMKVGEKGGIVKILARIIGPFFHKIFPDLDKNNKAFGPILLNVASNMLGLDNAATPIGLKAMKELQNSNIKKNTASNAQIMFLVLNTSGLTILPISIMTYRAQFGAVNPADIFIPILLATYFATLAGLISVAIYQRINLFNKTVLLYLGGLTLVIVGLIYYLSGLQREEVEIISRLASSFIIISLIVVFILLAVLKRVNVYETFVEGAKEGFTIAIKIIPYLIAVLVAIGVFRASGAMDILIVGIENIVVFFGVNSDFVPSLTTAFMKPLSGGAARGMMLETIKVYGVDSFVGRLSSIMQGATDTTFYVIAVYFGSVGIQKTRHAIQCGLIADFVGIVAAILIGYLFFY